MTKTRAVTVGCKLALTLLVLTVTVQCHGNAKPTSSGECGSQRFVTVAIGDALGRVRAAKRFAATPQRTTALAELEALIVAQIEAEPDSTFRRAAWRQADDGVYVKAADGEVDRIERTLSRAPTDSIAKTYRELSFRREYRRQLAEVVRSVDPKSPSPCATDAWQKMHAAAVRADAM